MTENNINIYYATMTGNAEDLAQDAEKRLKSAGYNSQVYNLSDVSPKDIQQSNTALFIVSTWGDGEPPEDAEDFYAEIENYKDSLNSLSYSILGLGDSSYPDFNEFARCLDKQLQRCQANAFLESTEADFDFEDTYEIWITKTLEILPSLTRQVNHA